MSDNGVTCTCVTDTSGLYAIAHASSNLKPILLENLKKGVIGVPACAMSEFTKLYEDEAKDIAPLVSTKISLGKNVYAGAARIADKLNSGFSRGAYDNHVELYTASISEINRLPILTASDQVEVYENMGCNVMDIGSWVEGLE